MLDSTALDARSGAAEEVAMGNGSARPSRLPALVFTVAATILVSCAGSGSTSNAQPATQAGPASAYQVTPQTTLEDLQLFEDDGMTPHLDRLDRNDYDIPAFLRKMQD